MSVIYVLLEMIALSAAKSCAWILNHKSINTSTVLRATKVKANIISCNVQSESIKVVDLVGAGY